MDLTLLLRDELARCSLLGPCHSIHSCVCRSNLLFLIYILRVINNRVLLGVCRGTPRLWALDFWNFWPNISCTSSVWWSICRQLVPKQQWRLLRYIPYLKNINFSVKNDWSFNFQWFMFISIRYENNKINYEVIFIWKISSWALS